MVSYWLMTSNHMLPISMVESCTISSQPRGRLFANRAAFSASFSGLKLCKQMCCQSKIKAEKWKISYTITVTRSRCVAHDHSHTVTVSHGRTRSQSHGHGVTRSHTITVTRSRCVAHDHSHTVTVCRQSKFTVTVWLWPCVRFFTFLLLSLK